MSSECAQTYLYKSCITSHKAEKFVMPYQVAAGMPKGAVE